MGAILAAKQESDFITDISPRPSSGSCLAVGRALSLESLRSRVPIRDIAAPGAVVASFEVNLAFIESARRCGGVVYSFITGSLELDLGLV